MYVEDDDYDPGPYTVMIPAGMTSASFDIDISNSSITSECVKNFSLTIIDRPFHHWRYRPDYHWIYKEYYWKYGPDYHWRHRPEYYWKYGPDYYWRHRPEYYWKYGPDYYWKIRKGYPSKAVVNIVGDCGKYSLYVPFSHVTVTPVLFISNISIVLQNKSLIDDLSLLCYLHQLGITVLEYCIVRMKKALYFLMKNIEQKPASQFLQGTIVD